VKLFGNSKAVRLVHMVVGILADVNDVTQTEELLIGDGRERYIKQ